MEMLLFVSCGLLAGLLAGYLGLGGGIIMVPFLTVVTGLDIKEAVPVSVTAIVVSSLATSNEYLKKGLVDLELVIILALFMVVGTVTGTSLAVYFPAESLQLALSVLLLYTAFSLIKSKNKKQPTDQIDNRNKHIIISSMVALVTGFLAGLLGVGGGVIIVPVLYLLIGLPLSIARGTSALMVGFSAAAASTVYLINGLVNIEISVLVILGIIVGGKIGGKLGAVAKPKPVKIIFFFLMLYLAYRLSSGPLGELL